MYYTTLQNIIAEISNNSKTIFRWAQNHYLKHIFNIQSAITYMFAYIRIIFHS